MRAMSPRAGWCWTVKCAGRSRRLVWALLLALLLPLAQAVAAHHTFTHHSASSQQPQRDSASNALDAKCAQCLQAAPHGGAAPPAPPTLAPAHSATQAEPAPPALPDAKSATALAYRSRAPPIALH